MYKNFAPGSPIPPLREEDAVLVAASKSFESFDQWMDVQLARLVELWGPLAAPNASRVPSPRQRGAQID